MTERQRSPSWLATLADSFISINAFKIVALFYFEWALFWLAIAYFVASDDLEPVVTAIFPPAVLLYRGPLLFLVPAIVAASITAVASWPLMERYSSSLLLQTCVASSVFIVVFVLCGEAWLKHRVDSLMPQPRPECLIERPFVKVFAFDRSQGHSLYVRDSAVYRWSYTQNGFYKSPTLMRNIPCAREHKDYWDSLGDPANNRVTGQSP